MPEHKRANCKNNKKVRIKLYFYLSLATIITGLDEGFSLAATSFIFSERHLPARSINFAASMNWYILLPTRYEGRNGAPPSILLLKPSALRSREP